MTMSVLDSVRGKPFTPRGAIDRLRGVSKYAWRDAARLAVQSATAGWATYVAMRLLTLDEIYIGILSAVYIVTPSVGGTLQAAGGRLVAAVVGSLVGLATLAALPWNYGTPFALAISLFVVSGITHFRSEWRYGVVAAVALSLGAEENAMEVAMDRGIAICIGALIGVLVTAVVWRETARARGARQLRHAIEALRARLSTTLETSAGDRESYDQSSEADYLAAYRAAVETLDIPEKGKGLHDKRVRALRRLTNSLIMLDRAEESLPRAARRFDGVAERLEDMNRCAYEILGSLAWRKTPEKETLDAFDEAVDGAQSHIRGSDGDAKVRRAAEALDLGLHEVRVTMRELVDAMTEDERPEEA